MNILLKFCFAALCTIQAILCDDLEVEVEHGWLRGKLQESVDGEQYFSFENIPYAQSPVGPLRFKAPEELDKWEGIRDATARGPMCPQYNPLSRVVNYGSEDCLTLDVYSTDLKGKKPVIVFFSSFAYSFGADSLDVYGPDFLVKDSVVVTFGYRIDVFGFLNLDTESVPGNAGLKDQVKMLQWVKQNIHKFGGDPNSVTLVGISSGSASIAHHLRSPLSSGLFHKAVFISGVPSCDAIYPHKVKEESYRLSELKGFASKDGDKVLDFLQTIPHEQLINSSYALAMEDEYNAILKKMSAFVPIVETNFGQERVITEDAMVSLVNQENLFKQHKVMIGYCDKEALILVNQYRDYLIDFFKNNLLRLVPNKILYKADALLKEQIAERIINKYFGSKDISVENMKGIIEYNSQSSMIYDVVKYAEKVADLTETYVFKFSSFSSRNLFGQEGAKFGIEGAAHGDPLFYVFQTPNMAISSEEREMIDNFVNSIVNFAKNGNPGDGWSPYTKEKRNYVEFTDKITAKEGLDENSKFWDDIYESVGIRLYD